MSKPKYKIGDQVEVINLAHPILTHEKGLIDLRPEWVGKKGIIVKVSQPQEDFIEYGLDWASWFNESNLKLIFRPAYARK